MRRWPLRRKLIVYYRRGGNGRGLLGILLAIVLIILSVMYFEMRLSPLIQQLAKVRVANLATKAINDAVDEEISGGRIKYDELITFEKNSEGQITALKTNMVKVNQIKVEVTNIILDRIESIDTSQLNVPLGNIINGDLFSGRGPKVPIRIIPTGVVTANFSNQFTSAGINQTRHQIIMELSVNMNVLTPGSSEVTQVTSRINVAETVIVGTVPENYTYFDEASDSTQKSSILDNK